MEVITLGNSGMVVSRLGMGCWAIGGHGWGRVDDTESIQAVRLAVERGITMFDTADVYGLGHSEEILSRALRDHMRDVVIASKFGIRWDHSGNTWKDISPKYMHQALEASLRRLHLDCIPLYYIHWPDGVTPIADTLGEMVRCKEKGKIRAIGVSNFSAPQLREALSVSEIHAVQVRFNLIDRHGALELLQLCAAHGIPLITWGSLADGLLVGKFNAKTFFHKNDHRSRDPNFQGERFLRNLQFVHALRIMAAQFGVTVAQLALRWLLDTPGVSCVLFGAKRPLQVKENLRAMRWRLFEEDYQRVNNLLMEASASQRSQ